MGVRHRKEPSGADDETTRAARKRMRQVVVQYLFIAAVLLGGSGRPGWGWAWAYLGIGILILGINALLLPVELIAERGQPGEGVKQWDRLIASLSTVLLLAMLIIIALDERFSWSAQQAVILHLAGLLLFALGQGLFSSAMASNAYFSTAVRIQVDRGHSVATSGPYRYVRHPGYVGFIIFSLGTPLALGSFWALIPAVLSGILLVIRTRLEDQTLLDELNGYREYAQIVRYRLLPGVW